MFYPKSVLRLLFLSEFLLSAAAADTQITFPSFSPNSQGDFFPFEDAAYDLTNRSYIDRYHQRQGQDACFQRILWSDILRETSAHSECSYWERGYLQHLVLLHVHDTRLALGEQEQPLGGPGSGFAFAIAGNVPMTAMHGVVSQMATFGVCMVARSYTQAVILPGFHVRFDTDYNLISGRDPSNNYILVTRNSGYDVHEYTHNLCGNDTHCTYFYNGRTFTVWIDFTSSSQSLEVRMANGSNMNAKPLQPLLLISNFEFPKTIGGEMLVSFWGSSDVKHREEHELLSWSFFSTEISESKFQMMLQYWKPRTWVGIITTGGVLVGTMAGLVILWSIYSFATPSSSYSALRSSTGLHVFSYKELRKSN